MDYEQNARLRNKAYWAWLQSLPGLTPRCCRVLLTRFGTPEEVFAHATQSHLTFEGLPQTLCASLRREARPSAVQAAVDTLVRHKIRIIPRDDADFPPMLAQLHDVPFCLYVKGDIASLRYDAGVTIVGTRSTTKYGKDLAFEIARDLATSGARVVSGLAYGIDFNAHMGALASARRASTIAVLPCGLDEVYPAGHSELAQRILQNGGALVSELPPGTSVQSYYIPHRNRLMAALGHGLLVVEAPHRSGVQHTVSAALDLGRDVFAVPHPANAPSGALCNELLRYGAAIACGASDILPSLSNEITTLVPRIKARSFADRSTRKPQSDERAGDTKPRDNQPQPRANEPQNDDRTPPTLTDDEALIIAGIGRDARSADELVARTGMPITKLFRILTTLMNRGIVDECEAGNRYVVRL